MALYFEKRFGLPQRVGTVDGSHIPILAPPDFHEEYYNIKGFHSVILQGVVDGRGQFWSVTAGQGRSLHDAHVLRLSQMWDQASSGVFSQAGTKDIGGANVGFYILGELAYPLQSWLLKPFHDDGRLTVEQQLYNRKTSKARGVVENAFVRLKGRWRCLLKRNYCDLDLTKSMILACCVLHNLCESHGEGYNSEWDTHIIEQVCAPNVAADIQMPEEEGRDARIGLMHYLTG